MKNLLKVLAALAIIAVALGLVARGVCAWMCREDEI